VDNSEEKLKRNRAEQELFEMWKRSTPKTVPSFVKMPQEEEKPQESPPPVATQPLCEPQEKKGFGGLLGKDIFKFLDLKNFELNSDRMLILLMIVLLSGEDSDNILLFALAYIML